MNTIVRRVVVIEMCALLMIFVLAYGAGSNSGGLSMLDFGALPFAAGLRLWTAGLLTVVAVVLLMWLATRVLNPLAQLTSYAQNLDAPDIARPEMPASDDDFAVIADQLRTASERLAAATSDQQRLAVLELRLADVAQDARRIGRGDLGLRFAPFDAPLGDVLEALNSSLDVITRVLGRARAVCDNLHAGAQQSVTSVQQVSKTLTEQHGELAAALHSFDAIPPAIKQVGDSSEVVMRSAQTAAAAVDQGRQQADSAHAEAERLTSSLRAVTDLLATLRSSTEHVAEMLRALSGVTERANLLALNAAIETARAGQAGRSSWIFAEQFRDLAHQSNTTSAELTVLVQGIQRDCDAALHALESGAQVAREVEQQAGRAAQSTAGAAAAINEARARAEVIGLASARQGDAARSVGSALQAGQDLQQLAAQQARQAAAVSEELLKLQADLKSALASLRTAPIARAAIAGASLADPRPLADSRPLATDCSSRITDDRERRVDD